jgi:NAD(P)-dependent dehydrogenase (short-subunit alcohol dehydrogenase family)
MAYNIELSGRVAFITGAFSGLGSQFARTLSRAGVAHVQDVSEGDVDFTFDTNANDAIISADDGFAA